MITNQTTVTIKMSRVEALMLARLVASMITEESETWKNIHEKIRDCVDRLDRKGNEK